MSDETLNPGEENSSDVPSRAQTDLFASPNSNQDEPEFDSTNSSNRDQSESKKSRWIGKYKLLQMLGAGGMGEVWLAEQSEPVRRRVAVKLIKDGNDSKSFVARFEAERQALALMDHSSIARIVDGGTTTSGQPFFVMELVAGISITKYCDKNKLSLRERLKLFIQVCNGVQHAHQKGILHRDLKPSNILVTTNENKPIAKIIDFGLAKALDRNAKLTDKTLFTEFGTVVGTLQYMSPEQAELDSLDIDTRADIYALGILLYELLTGSTPIEEDSLKKQALLEILRTIREKEPPRPSDRLSSSGILTSRIRDHMQIDPTQLRKMLRGDLDWVVMKAIEKDRLRRYASASDFAADIERYISDQPVVARPPSASYRIQKFVRKNRSVVASISAIIVLLVAGVLGTSIFAYKANREKTAALAAQAETMEKIVELASANALQKKALHIAMDSLDAVLVKYSTDPRVTQEGLADSQLEILQLASKQYETLLAEFEEQPSLARETERCLRLLGLTYPGFGRFDDALAYAKKADSMWSKIPTSSDADLINQAQLKRFIGYCLYQKKDGTNAVAYHTKGLELLASVSDNYQPKEKLKLEEAVAHTYLGEAQLLIGQPMDALPIATESFSRSEQIFRMIDPNSFPMLATPDSPEPVTYYRGMNLFNLAMGTAMQGAYDEALPHISLSRELLNALAIRHPENATYRSRQARALMNFLILQQGTAPPKELEKLALEALKLNLELWQQFPFNAPIRASTITIIKYCVFQNVVKERDEMYRLLPIWAKILSRYPLENPESSSEANDIASGLSVLPIALLELSETIGDLKGDEQTKLAETLGLTIQELSKIRYADESQNSRLLPSHKKVRDEVRKNLEKANSPKVLEAFDGVDKRPA
jgi:serine/threonine protein kinase